MTNNLVQTWVSVTDVNGRTRLEARWIPAPQSGAPSHVTYAA
jgi:hypothetical protein